MRSPCNGGNPDTGESKLDCFGFNLHSMDPFFSLTDFMCIYSSIYLSSDFKQVSCGTGYVLVMPGRQNGKNTEK